MIVRGQVYDHAFDKHFAGACHLNEPLGTILYEYDYGPICRYHREKYRRHLHGKRHQRKTSKNNARK